MIVGAKLQAQFGAFCRHSLGLEAPEFDARILEVVKLVSVDC